MGRWGVRSDENDATADALDAAFEAVHGDRYDDLMDDRNPTSVDQIHARLADPRTLQAALDALRREFGDDPADWDEVGRLGYIGIVVRHAELGVEIPQDDRRRSLEWLAEDDFDWEQATRRSLRRDAEIRMLRRGDP